MNKTESESTPYTIRDHVFDLVDQYARRSKPAAGQGGLFDDPSEKQRPLFSKNPEEEGGRWLTINGAHVYVSGEDGRIMKGPKRLMGKTREQIERESAGKGEGENAPKPKPLAELGRINGGQADNWQKKLFEELNPGFKFEEDDDVKTVAPAAVPVAAQAPSSPADEEPAFTLDSTPEPSPAKPPALVNPDPANKQGALFDTGKGTNDLKGQELLFNSDAGDLANPKTMENRAQESAEEKGPQDGETNEKGLTFRNGRWHRDGEEINPADIAAKARENGENIWTAAKRELNLNSMGEIPQELRKELGDAMAATSAGKAPEVKPPEPPVPPSSAPEPSPKPDESKPVSFSRHLGKMSKESAHSIAPKVGERFENNGKMYEITSIEKPYYHSKSSAEDMEDFGHYNVKPGWHSSFKAKPVEFSEEEKSAKTKAQAEKQAASSLEKMVSWNHPHWEGAESIGQGDGQLPSADWSHVIKKTVNRPGSSTNGKSEGGIYVDGDTAYFFHPGSYDDYRTILKKQTDPEKVDAIRSEIESAHSVIKLNPAQAGSSYRVQLSGSKLQPSEEESKAEKQKKEAEEKKRAEEAEARAAERKAKAEIAPEKQKPKNRISATPKTESRNPTATFAKLKDGSWGLRVTGKVKSGDTVTVKKKDGSTQVKKVAKVISSYSDATLVSFYSVYQDEVNAVVDRYVRKFVIDPIENEQEDHIFIDKYAHPLIHAAVGAGAMVLANKAFKHGPMRSVAHAAIGAAMAAWMSSAMAANGIQPAQGPSSPAVSILAPATPGQIQKAGNNSVNQIVQNAISQHAANQQAAATAPPSPAQTAAHSVSSRAAGKAGVPGAQPAAQSPAQTQTAGKGGARPLRDPGDSGGGSFNNSDHPRHPAGASQSKGGEFAPKGGAEAGSTGSEAPSSSAEESGGEQDDQDESILPRNYPDNLNKPADEQTNYSPPERSVNDLAKDQFENRAPWKSPAAPNPRKAIWGGRSLTPSLQILTPGLSGPSADELKAQKKLQQQQEREQQKAEAKKQKELERATSFDPDELDSESMVDDKEFNIPKPKEEDFQTPRHLAKVRRWRSQRPMSNGPGDEAKIAKWKLQEPQSFESAMKEWNRRKGAHQASITKKIAKNVVPEIAVENELDPADLQAAVDDEIASLLPHHKRQEEARRYVSEMGFHAGRLNRMEDSGKDHSSTNMDERASEWAGLFPEIAGTDESMWVEKMWNLSKQGVQDPPSSGDEDLVRRVAQRMMDQNQLAASFSSAEEDESEGDLQPVHGSVGDVDYTPFSRSNVGILVDRYMGQIGLV